MNHRLIRAQLRRGTLPPIAGGSPVPLGAASTTVAASVTITSTTEQVLATLTIPSVPALGLTIRLFAFAAVLAGANATVLTFRVRRGSTITGTLVGIAETLTVTSATNVLATHAVEDAPGDVANQQYVLTCQQNTGPGNGTMTNGEMHALIY